MNFIELKSNNKFFVTGKKSFELSGAKEYILNNFSSKKKIDRFYDFSSNPKFEDVKKGVDIFRKNNYDCIVAIGGGSVIDMAKLIAYFSEIGTDVFQYSKKLDLKIKCPIVAIPTTAGSGTEETHFAVIYHNKKKYSIAHPSLKPIIKIIKPELAFKCSKKQKIISALDAFCQSIESYWSKNSTPISREYSLKSLNLLIDNLEQGIILNDFNSFKNIVKASNYAGKAINISKTTACHALSYFFTTKYNIPHGQSVAMLMPYVFDYHIKNIKKSKKMNVLKEILSFESDDYISEFNNFYIKLGLNCNLDYLGINILNDIEDLKNNINLERLNNNPINIDLNKLFLL